MDTFYWVLQWLAMTDDDFLNWMPSNSVWLTVQYEERTGNNATAIPRELSNLSK